MTREREYYYQGPQKSYAHRSNVESVAFCCKFGDVILADTLETGTVLQSHGGSGNILLTKKFDVEHFAKLDVSRYPSLLSFHDLNDDANTQSSIDELRAASPIPSPSSCKKRCCWQLAFILLSILGEAHGDQFTSGDQLKIAVDNCLFVDPSGVSCCAVADCGPAGSDEMNTWNVSSVTNMEGLFSGAAIFNADISAWDVSAVTNMYGMFYKATAFSADISYWNTSSVTHMNYMFYEASAFIANISDWDVSSVINTYNMFWGAENFNANISDWDVSSVEYMGGMFGGAKAFNADISGWDVSNVIEMGSMFRGSTAFGANISCWNTKNLIYMDGIFKGAESFDADISGWDVSKVSHMNWRKLDVDKFWHALP